MGAQAVTPPNKAYLRRLYDSQLQMEREYTDKQCCELAAKMERLRNMAPAYTVPWQVFDDYNTAVEKYQAIMEEIQRRHIP